MNRKRTRKLKEPCFTSIKKLKWLVDKLNQSAYLKSGGRI